ncbi:MAG: zinc-binding dehydrogenase [Xanthomonadales bacterium]|nr:zinc-binding dehydrogenase [Xanthomonadales bacterium]
MRVRAAVLRQMGLPAPYAQSRPVQIESLELAPPGRDELLLRVLAAGLCHSDLSVIDGSRPRGMPMVLGHEACAEVVECGPGCAGFAVGDRVVSSFVPSCGHCVPCAGGRAALCETAAQSNAAGTLLGGERRWPALDGATLQHHLGVSAFAEHCVVSVRSVVKVPPDLDPAIAALFGCAVLTGVGAVTNTAAVAAGDSVAVFGLGGVGMAAVLGARASGAQPLIAIDLQPAKRALALSLGASHAIDAADPDAVAQIRAISGGGVRHAIECVGSAAVLARAYAATARGGCTVSAGLPDPSQQLTLPAVSLVAEERTLRGSYMGSAVPSRDIPRYLSLYRAGLLPVDRLLSHRLTLAQINEGFDRLASGEALRQVVDFEGSAA